ncbi:hypothetical protein I5U14_17115 [Stenotrophomonas maltophilia]|uniref:hypothetical protein n=1 Tax=Stenotrophomonas maltophilia TaxID=40324 RepID=UPI0018D460EE|nr:hypothetical protein [Stenotrophomonas maltophilia]MBH1412177.1 hypothetical protein [Stenotrophomonas maltophilia]MBH1866858.1 hypothetical protein [Stenotrophomonas maltophilia]MDG9942134.1 hypothetical protein [Stenotrophomonas maltophilia]
MPDVKLSQLAAASPASVAAGAGLWTMAGHILGLSMEYVGPASIRVSSGSAWIPSLQQAIEVPSALTLSGLTLAANTWYHLYLYLNSSTPAIEAVMTAPAAPYSGTARAKTGDTTRRYLGSFRTNASAQILNFVHEGGKVLYQGSYPRPLTNGTATTEIFVSLADAIPVTARVANLRHTNNATNSASRMNNSSGPAYPSFLANFAPGADAFIEFVVNADKTVSYWNGVSPTPQGVYLSVIGYTLER